MLILACVQTAPQIRMEKVIIIFSQPNLFSRATPRGTREGKTSLYDIFPSFAFGLLGRSFIAGPQPPAIEKGREKTRIEDWRRSSEGRSKGFGEGVKLGAGINRAQKNTSNDPAALAGFSKNFFSIEGPASGAHSTDLCSAFRQIGYR